LWSETKWKTMTTPIRSKTSSYLWVAVALLGTATLGMAAALVQQRSAAEPQPAVVVTAPLAVSAVQALAPTVKPAISAKPEAKKTVPKVAAKPVEYAQAAPEMIAKVPPTMAEPVVAQLPKEVCASCGTVESVTPVQREAQGSGAGVVAGALLGGLLGNQVGGGDGKTIATVIGVLGGGWAGNTVEKRMKKEIIYQVTVRMDDGSTRMLEQSTPATVGARVTVQGNTIGPAMPKASDAGAHTAV
jgi:outer membrane lipoprotein SlyB